MKRPVVPMFHAGMRVVIRWYGQALPGRVDMASAKHRSLFITTDGGETLTILGMPRGERKRNPHRGRRATVET